MVKRVVKDSDIVLIILDARMPGLSRNRILLKMIRFHKKKYIYVFNKIDLVSEVYLKGLKKDFEDAYFVSGSKNIGLKKLKTELLIRSKRMKKDVIIGVVGYPNVGKSAIINALAKRAKAKVARVAGTTKGLQLIKAGGLKILDSPGVVPFEDNEIKLGILGAKNPEKIKNIGKVVFALIKSFIKGHRKGLGKHYGIDISGKEEYEILLEIGKKRGFLLKKGVIDENRTSLAILRDWQRGKLGI